ncbi:MAG: O-antigen ligase family protein [Gemmatimonadaceae bacterium]
MTPTVAERGPVARNQVRREAPRRTFDRARFRKVAASPWSVGTVSLIVYLFVVHSYKINLGTTAIVLGLFGVLVHERPIRVSPAMYWFAGYLAWALIGVPGSVDASSSFTAWTDTLKILLIMFLALNAIRTPAQHRLITLAWLGMFAFYPVRGTLFNFLSGAGSFGRYGWNFVFSNFNDMAALTLIPLAMSLERLRSTDKKWVKACALAGLIVLPFIILITQSRAGEMGLALMMLYLLTNSRYKARLFVAMLAIAGVALAFAPKSVWDRIRGMSYLTSVETLGLSDSSAEQRYVIWQVAEKIIADNPVSGVGIGAYSRVHEQYAFLKPEWDIAKGPRDTHSTYLHVLAETGVIGLALFLMIFFSAFYELQTFAKKAKKSTLAVDRQLRDRCQAYQAALIGLTICAVFGSMQTMVFPFLLIAMGAAAVRTDRTLAIAAAAG